ncbi:MAG: glycosyl hydrolase [Leptolyngbyaceae cyanobacterium SM1_1_3]|nr:glycosyl hydrolase [Leptolyngbyaceae cyanobacterium SM1_1_3]NJN02969.1 glycosyl hydrolase [Leptolyngbyaceae cyanobacterium RM1_1_2]NJO10757.1 glycosyl hydrolase [Leptolyngbyaceae cyanobacterium SL_1_1]
MLKTCRLLTALVLLGVVACSDGDRAVNQDHTDPFTAAAEPESQPETQSEKEIKAVLTESWEVYQQRFIQGDGRVIDFEASDRSVSEGQAYGMLRAVLIDDPATFTKTLSWAEANLRRKQDGQVIDQLWGWQWGRQENDQWGLIDANFASDADIDAAFALILAARRWQQPKYLELAQAKLKDIWDYSTLEVKSQRYLLPGPAEAFKDPTYVYLNPSYLAPYAFRLFAEVDPERNWLQLVNSSYQILEKSATLSSPGLPSDWVALNVITGNFEPVPASSSFKNQYGFDAYRVWWRVAWDEALYDAEPAWEYLKDHLQFLETRWQADQTISAEFDLAGKPLADYDAIAQYAMLHAAFNLTSPAIAASIYQRQIAPRYQAGIWDNQSAYYSQNLVWLGLYPPAQIKPLLQSE